jgi:endonuclease/exonuclease/phosphatase family metal-dependent hydrolase
MRHFFLSAFILLALCATTGAQNLFVGSYNIRNQNNEDVANGNGWTRRCPVICDMLNFESPDIFGSQEVLVAQLHDMLSKLDGYDYIGVGRDDGKEAGEYAPIFYKKERLTLLRSGHFWLSPTPTLPGVKGWDAVCPRICTWGFFADKKSKLRFYYFNLHMDHIGVVARRESAKLVIARIKEMAKGMPVILTGDFNVDQNDNIYNIFSTSGVLKDTFANARHRFATNGTFNNFETNLWTTSRVDHIFVSPAFDVRYFGVITNSYWTPSDSTTTKKGKDAPKEINLEKYTERTPSDHYPIFARIVYMPKK